MGHQKMKVHKAWLLTLLIVVPLVVTVTGTGSDKLAMREAIAKELVLKNNMIPEQESAVALEGKNLTGSSKSKVTETSRIPEQPGSNGTDRLGTGKLTTGFPNECK
uniref:Uncharacterized protein n=1 Tax=Anopheles farauti TaxID=69004 RepID=A0A182Q254_9DIPT